MLLPDTSSVAAQHEAAGRHFSAGGSTASCGRQADGEPVECLHGVPASCFLYRSVIHELGIGLARPGAVTRRGAHPERHSRVSGGAR